MSEVEGQERIKSEAAKGRRGDGDCFVFIAVSPRPPIFALFHPSAFILPCPLIVVQSCANERRQHEQRDGRDR